mgnify:CR=1 FL=1
MAMLGYMNNADGDIEMTELFLVNMVHEGGVGNYGGITKAGDWVCFQATHSLADASDTAKSLREAGRRVCVQSVLLNENGKVTL